jgi:hypothetical protein
MELRKDVWPMPAAKRSRPSNAGKGQRAIEPIEALCGDCVRKTLHDILHTKEVYKPDYVETFETIQCRGCSRVSLRETTVIKDDFAFYEKPRLVRLLGLETFRTMILANNIREIRDLGRLREEVSPNDLGEATPEERLLKKAWQEVTANPSEWLKEDTFIEFHPPPTSRRRPDWAFGGIFLFEEESLLEVLDEIYVATRNRLPHLAIMGIRAVLEQVMIKNNDGDYGNFDKNIHEFQKNGFISKVERESLAAILKVGHAVIHRNFKVTQEELDIALNIMEGVLAAIHHHREPAKEFRPDGVDVGRRGLHNHAVFELLARVPPRRPRRS